MALLEGTIKSSYMKTVNFFKTKVAEKEKRRIEIQCQDGLAFCVQRKSQRRLVKHLIVPATKDTV